MQEASGADFTDLNRSAHLPSSIDPAMSYRRHIFHRSSPIPAKQLGASRASAPVVISSARTGLVSEQSPRVAAVEQSMRSIAAADLCHWDSCAFVIRGFKTK